LNNNNKKTTKPSIIIAAATIVVVIISAGMILGIQGQTSHNVLAQSAKSNATTAAANTTIVRVTPSQSTNKTFWISTVHFDGPTALQAGVACGNCTQNIPPHPAEKFPNTTLPAGPGLVLRPPNKVGAWDMRSFTFAPDQIVVNQGDTVTLHFLGVQGPHHVITVDGVGTFPLDRGHIHTVTFTTDKPGTITYWCHVHPPNMVGQILVLPKPA
jgi:FtsP/CotA-like multicopper oxidase with cupredoxin domain